MSASNRTAPLEWMDKVGVSTESISKRTCADCSSAPRAAAIYFAPPVKRVHIPKGDGQETRGIGMPTIEDKVLQRAVTVQQLRAAIGERRDEGISENGVFD